MRAICYVTCIILLMSGASGFSRELGTFLSGSDEELRQDIAIDESGNAYQTVRSEDATENSEYKTINYFQLATNLTPTGTFSLGRYTYYDDFSTDTVRADSYYHSPIFTRPPDISLDGLLIYLRFYGLAFCKGFLVDSYAFLAYRFPIIGSFDSIQSGIIEVDAYSYYPLNPHISIYLSRDGSNWHYSRTIYDEGHYIISLLAGGTHTYIKFIGEDLIIGRILVSITGTIHTPWPIVFDFTTDRDDWTTGGAPIVFTAPDFVWEPDYLKMTSSTNTNTFGFWQSRQDAIPADADYLYRARFKVSSNLTAKLLVPQIRLRANSLNLQQYDVVSIESAGDGAASPDASGTDYDLYFVPPANDTAAMLAFDLLNFNPDDAAVAELSLDTVTVDRFALDSLSTPTVVQDYTFDLSQDGWTTGGVPIVFSPPQYIHSSGALELRATTNTNTFGFWGSHPADITIEVDKLYRGTFEVRTDVTNPAMVPEMRLRFNTGNVQASHTLGIASIGDGANSPGITNTTYDRLYFLPPANCVGEGLIVSFDILNFSPDDAATASFILDRAIIENLSPPSLP